MPEYIYDKKSSNLTIKAPSESDFPSDSDVLELLKNVNGVQTVSCFVGKEEIRKWTVSNGRLLLIDEAKKGMPKLPKISFFGKITSDPISIDEARLRGGSVVISGQLTMLDSFPLRDEKVLVTMGVCDGAGGISGKYFAKNAEDAAAISSTLRQGQYVKVQGRISYDSFDRDDSIMISRCNLIPDPNERWDHAKRKRVELHLHTNISEQDGLGSVKEHFALARRWGHPALAITDNVSTQGFIDAFDFGKSNNFKVIYGMDAYVVDDISPFLKGIDEDYPLSGRFVVFDIETTGLSARNEQIIEIGAVKVEGSTVIDTFSSFVHYDKPLSEFTKNLTNITDEMLVGAPKIDDVFAQFVAFVGDLPLVAHNADFDMSFVNKLCEDKGISYFSSIDTIQLARQFLPIKRYGLETLVRHLKIPFSNHHRAVADADVTASAFMYFTKMFAEKGLYTVGDLNAYMREHLDVKSARPSKVLILVKSEAGRIELYRLLSKANVENMGIVPHILLSDLLAKREFFLLGSGGEGGALFDAALMMKSDAELRRIAGLFDFIELMPAANFYLEGVEDREDYFNSEDQVRELFARLYNIALETGKMPVATGDVHFLNPEDMLSRDIMLFNRTRRAYINKGLKYFRTTEEMLEEFSYLGEDAERVVVDNSIYIASQTEPIQPVPSGTFTPSLDGANEELTTICYETARRLYGETLPEIVEKRIQKELKAIIANGFASLYLISNKMVKKSLEDGYSVGSRGSVGSSLVAFLGGISDVNPLPAHYHCEECRYSEFVTTPLVGTDLPLKNCPRCETQMERNGFDIPFEAFLGFDGDKEPDIDLNFASVYQSTAQKYCEVLFGEGYTFKAGTIGTYADKTAMGNVIKYAEDKGKKWHKAVVKYYSNKIEGAKRAAGQHPAGVLVLPKDYDINYFTPVVLVKIEGGSDYAVATQYDYNMLHGTLLKLDVLGHESPTALRMLHDYTGVDFTKIRLDDPDTISIFSSCGVLNMKGEDPNNIGAIGIPEFGTPFVLGMLKTTRPTNVTDLVRISGLSHGTMVWRGNAEEDVLSGRVPFNEVIATREDIMNKLIVQGCEAKTAFKIMEKVRKGKGVDQNDLAELKRVNMPDWYIESCQKISYLFPKAHAAAYVMQSIRIAYFKVHYPLAFYAMFFSLNVADFDISIVIKGEAWIQSMMTELDKPDASAKDKDKSYVLKLVLEMYKRGFQMMNVDLMQSDATKFRIVDGRLLPPLQSVKGVAENAAKQIVEAREESGEFLSIEDFQKKTGVNRSAVEGLEEAGVFEGLSRTNQLSFF